MIDNIPSELQCLPNWVGVGEGKIPLNPFTGAKADVTDPNTWGTFEQARGRFPAIGFVFSPNDPYAVIDLDNKVENPASPEQLQRHHKILEAFQTYTEISTSGRGYHIIVKASIPSGRNRDHVELYSSGRYMICTGNVWRNAPIVDYNNLLNQLYDEMPPPQAVANLVEEDGILSDTEVVEMGMRASNAEKFNTLCAGDMIGYPSQSEADFALISMLAFYTRDNEQVRRLFRMSELGKRDKATKDNKHLDRAIGKFRAKQPPPVDFTALIANAEKLQPPKTVLQSPPENAETGINVTLPPGLVGEIAQYIFATAVRPVPEIALTAAIALMAGITGRAFNISGMGLNHYIIVLAKTGSGKEGAQQGISKLIASVRQTVPMIDEFFGPSAFASGQALVRVIDAKPCFVSILGEFGLTLQQISDHRANSALIMLHKVLLDLYSKSGWDSMLRSSAYADAEKNTKNIQAPNVTILGESTPESFYDGLGSSHISEGLIPRFSIIEYHGKRPAINQNANCPPSPDLVQKVADIATTSLTTTNNNSVVTVQMTQEGKERLDAFNVACDKIMNDSNNEVELQLWNRAHLKALKLGALIAVGVHQYQPCITDELAAWAIDFITAEITGVAKRFEAGDVGMGDSKQAADLQRKIEAYFQTTRSTKTVDINSAMFKDKIIPYAIAWQRVSGLSSFKNDRLGVKAALKNNIQLFIDLGYLVEIPKPNLANKYGYSGNAYGIGNSWPK